MLGAGANRNQQWGTGNQGRGRGDKKANGICAANPHPGVRGERRPVGGRAIHQTHTRRRKQAHAKQKIAQKQRNATKKANFAAQLRSVRAEDHKTRGQSV